MNVEHPGLRQVPQLKKLWQEAFGDSQADIDLFFHKAYAPERCLCIREGDALLAAAYWLDYKDEQGPLAYIYAVATAREARGQGLCRHLMEHIHRLLGAQGYAGAVLVPADEGLGRMYERMGYRYFAGMDTICRTPGAACALRQVDVQEYHRLRQRYLPQGSPVPGSAAMEFLGSTSSFAAGADFVLAYSLEEDRLFSAELLGDIGAIPGILGALHARQGSFRIPGTRPFAMFHPLNGSRPPLYWGHAFD